MIYTFAAGLASAFSLSILVLMAAWYAIPWLKGRSRADALTPLLWVHALRYVAFQIFSAQHFGFAVSDATRNQILAGDVIGAVLAVLTIIALRKGALIAIGLAWLFAVETALDLAMGVIAGINERLFATASAVTWLILAFYVPLLWVTLGLIVWQLYSRRGEPISRVRGC
jgi:hypothetical protein